MFYSKRCIHCNVVPYIGTDKAIIVFSFFSIHTVIISKSETTKPLLMRKKLDELIQCTLLIEEHLLENISSQEK